jgi:hypothetical protein
LAKKKASSKKPAKICRVGGNGRPSKAKAKAKAKAKKEKKKNAQSKLA